MTTRAADPDVDSARLIDHLREQVEKGLGELDLGGDLPILDDPIRYVLAGGGKRLRPVLVLLAARLWKKDLEDVVPLALSVEVFHNFTLVHDDIMDRASERRGRPTVHMRWDESTAILSGDYMLALSYELLAKGRPDRLVDRMACFHRMVRLLCEGQALDKAFETQKDVSVEDYFRMIHAKTGALIECALELGGIEAGASDGEIDALQEAGRHLGGAFQMQDDLLDITATDARWGKTIGGDLIEGKRTFILLRAIERTTGDERRWFERIIDEGGLDPALVPEARGRLDQAGVLAEAAEGVHEHSRLAHEALRRLPAGAARDAIASVIDRMQTRAH